MTTLAYKAECVFVFFFNIPDMLPVTKSKFIYLVFWTVNLYFDLWKEFKLYESLCKNLQLYFPEAHLVSNLWLLEKGPKTNFY